ncbi:MAG TPA: prolipoprotein diacylglyceryl transferase [Anaerolineae bacterium]|nr:prolipoprotein diacylglyceryl transferase [Anaerolineae bacterium]
MRIGPWWIELYTLRILCGALGGLLCLWLRAPAWGLSRRVAGGWLWGVALAALLCGRGGYVLGHHVYFNQHPQAILRLEDVGGLHGGTALIGSLLVVWLWARVSQRTFNELLAWLSPAILLFAAGAWWGCASVGCAWGHPTAMPLEQRSSWFVTQAPDLYHNVASRYAVQNLGSLCAFLSAGIALTTHSKAPASLALYELASGALTFLRADEVPLIAGLRIDTLQDIGIAWVILWSLGKCQTTGAQTSAP